MPPWLRRLRRWTWRDCGLLAESVVVALFVEIAIRSMKMITLLRLIDRIATLQRPSLTTTLDADRLARFAAAPYRLLSLNSTCLRESLVLCTLLNRRGAHGRVCFGVDRQGSALSAHAWVEVECGITAGGGTPYHELRSVWSA
jgi:hypothetical protein